MPIGWGFPVFILADKLVIFRMGSYPEPENAVFNFNAQGPIAQTNSYGLILLDLLEMQGRVRGIFLKQFIIPPCKFLNVGWQPVKTRAEFA